MYVFQNDHGVMQRRYEMKDVIKYTIKIILTVSSTIALILGGYYCFKGRYRSATDCLLCSIMLDSIDDLIKG